MILTTKGRYAVMAVIEIADSNSKKPVPLFLIAEKQSISLSYLEQIFAHLRKGGIVKAIKGPGGGYVLAKDAKEITIANIIGAIGESIKMTRCRDSKDGCLAPNNAKCKTHNLWHGLEKSIYSYLESISLHDVCSGSLKL